MILCAACRKIYEDVDKAPKDCKPYLVNVEEVVKDENGLVMEAREISHDDTKRSIRKS
jgi:hypothetical protein